MFVLMEVCWRDLPMASATLMKRFAKRVSMIGSTPFRGLFCGIVIVSSSSSSKDLWKQENGREQLGVYKYGYNIGFPR